jgi:hypothetical protein
MERIEQVQPNPHQIIEELILVTAGVDKNIDRLIVHQLPSYSPDYNPIKYLWKKVKTKATHNRYFAEFAKLIRSVEDALTILASQADEIKRLMGVYIKHMAQPLFA